jgi:hypothetical protein
MAKKEPNKTVATDKMTAPSREGFVFAKVNFQLLIASVITIVIGYALMAGGKSNDPNKFSEEIFNFQRITLAPIIVLAGYAIGIYAILKKSKDAE